MAPKTGFDKWKDGINKSVGDARWDFWDCEIQTAVGEYNAHLSGKAGYVPLDWQLIKAMIWVETGADNSEWNSKPMQIGVVGDPGLTALLSGNEGGNLVLPPILKERLTVTSVRGKPEYNIRAGIGYLLMRMANFEYQTVLDNDAAVYEVTVKPGDSLAKIAKTKGSTVEILTILNPTVSVLRPGQVLKFQKGSVQKIIGGWREFSTRTIAVRYNSMRGDPNYDKKLDYVLSLVRTRKAAPCAQ